MCCCNSLCAFIMVGLQLFLPNKVKIGLHYCVIITYVVKFVILFLLYMLPEASESD